MCTVPVALARRSLAVVAAVAAFAAVVFATAPPAHAAFGAPVVVTSADLGEPGIDVAPNGTLYVNAPTGVLSNVPGSPSDVFRSRDGGATWTLLPAGLKANLPGGGDSDLSLDPATGAIAETDLWLGSATVSSTPSRTRSRAGSSSRSRWTAASRPRSTRSARRPPTKPAASARRGP